MSETGYGGLAIVLVSCSDKLFHKHLFCRYRSRMLSDNPIETIEPEAFKLGASELVV